MCYMEMREKAKRLYLQGKSIKEISAELEIKSSTLRSWKLRDQWPIVQQQRATKKTVATKEMLHNTALTEYEGLNFQQQLFCEIYVNNYNATQAYLKVYGCDYNSARSAGARLLTDDSVRAYVKYLKELKAQSIMVNEIDIVDRYMKIAFADYTDYVEFGETMKPVVSGGNIVKDINPATGELQPVMHRVNFLKLIDSNRVDGGLIEDVHIGKDGAAVKLSDRMKALEWLTKYFEMNSMDRHKIEYDKRKQELDRLEYERRKKNDERGDW